VAKDKPSKAIAKKEEDALLLMARGKPSEAMAKKEDSLLLMAKSELSEAVAIL
jgi:hypothetical protein